MKPRLLALAGAVGLALLLPVLLLAAALQAQPSVAASPSPRQEDVAAAVELLRQHDPRHAVAGRVATAVLTESELELLLEHGTRHWLDAASHVGLERAAATVQISLHLPPHALDFLGRWLNVDVRLVESAGLPVIDSLQVGRLPVPVALAEVIGQRLLERAGLDDELALAREVVQQVHIVPRQMSVRYAWVGGSQARALAALAPAADQPRLHAYAEGLARIVAAEAPPDGGWTVPLVRLLAPLFRLAQERSAAGGDAAAENRAALVALTLYANGIGLDKLVPAARSWPRPRRLQVMLAGRDDFPLHFLVSAALAAEGTGALSKAIGLYKEVADSRGGSGFSFTDMAANRAGTRFGELAVQQARRLQAEVARGLADPDLVPATADLPEFMPEPEFLQRFGGVGAPAYDKLLADIDRRIAALPLLR